MGSNISHTDDSEEETTQGGPYYGEYYCHCGRKWTSILSWPNNYQICKRCRSKIYPKNQRAVLPEDQQRETNEPGHPQELCGKCQELGRYCGYTNRSGLTDHRGANENFNENKCIIL